MFNFNVRNLSQYEKELIAKALHLQPDFITGSVVIDRNEMFLDIPKDMLFTSSNQERVGKVCSKLFPKFHIYVCGCKVL